MDVADEGVIDCDSPPSKKVVESDKDCGVVVPELTTCNTFPPAAAAAHFKPVASALSATNLIQEQSQRIVLIGDYSSVNGDYA